VSQPNRDLPISHLPHLEWIFPIECDAFATRPNDAQSRIGASPEIAVICRMPRDDETRFRGSLRLFAAGKARDSIARLGCQSWTMPGAEESKP
jgi:hypothetical protein